MELTRRLLLILVILGVSLQGCIAQGGDGGGLTRGSFPKGFVFGTASSAYQVCDFNSSTTISVVLIFLVTVLRSISNLLLAI
jgi:hypothetical protein